MSDIFDLTNDLFDAILFTSESMQPLEVERGSSISDVDNRNSTSMELLEDCAFTLLQDIRMPSKSANLPKCDKREKDTVDTFETIPLASTSMFMRDEKQIHEEIETERQMFMQAAMKRIKREKEGKNLDGSAQKAQMMPDEVTCENDTDEGETQTTAGAAEMEALTCLEEFRADVESFKAKWGEDERRLAKRPDCAIEFAQEIESKYTSRLERLSSLKSSSAEYNVKVAKIKKLVNAFSRRCRAFENHHADDAEGSRSTLRTSKATAQIARLCAVLCSKRKSKVLCKFKYWTCKVCGKRDLEFDQFKCSCCGRPKTYRPPPKDEMTVPPFQDPITEGEEFLSGASWCEKKKRKETKSKVTIKEERLRKQYLYRKVDLELDMRTELKEEVGDLLDSIHSTKRRLQLLSECNLK